MKINKDTWGGLAIGTIPVPSGISTLPAPITTAANIQSFANGVTLWAFYGLTTLSVIMVLIAGFYYATSSGEPERVKKANQTFIYAAIAMVVALVAYGMPKLIQNFFTGK